MKKIRLLGAVCGSILSASLLFLPVCASGSTLSWNAGSGLTPDSIATPYSLVTAGTAGAPTLGSGQLTIATTTPGTNNAYYVQHSPDVDFTGAHEITYRMRLDSSSSTAASRTAAGVVFTTSTNVGQSLYMGVGEIFLTKATGTGIAVSAALNTSIFHDYKITLAGTTAGSAVSVFVDGGLLLTDTLFSLAPAFGATERILFGELSTVAFGESVWTSFVHDASTATVVPLPASLWLFTTGMFALLGFAKRRKEKA